MIQQDDLPADIESLQQENVQKIVAEELAYIFNLERFPLLRVRLLRRDDDNGVLIISNHHILLDGWSQGIFVRELTALYASGDGSQIAPLPVQYADYAVWQRQWLDSARLENLLAYWRQKLADYPPALEQENLAYLLYISGSTGKPKGVAITHRSAVAMISWAQTVYSDTELSRVLAGTSICFDLSVFEIFVTLAAGGTVVWRLKNYYAPMPCRFRCA